MNFRLPIKLIRRQEDGKIEKQWLFIAIIVAVFVIVFLLGAAVLAFEVKYQNKFFPGTRIGNVSLEGLTPAEALDTLDAVSEKIEKEGIKIIYENNGGLYLKITPVVSALGDPDLSREVISFDNRRTVSNTFQFGRNKSWWRNLFSQIRFLLKPERFEASVKINDKFLEELLKKQVSELDQPGQNARPVVKWQGDYFSIEISPEKPGLTFDYKQAIIEARDNLRRLGNTEIKLKQIQEVPTINEAEALMNVSLIENILSTSTPKLTYKKNYWKLDNKKLSELIEFQKDEDGRIVVGLDKEKFVTWLEQEVASQINIEPRDANIEFVDGRITKFITHRDGVSVNLNQTYDAINKNLSVGDIEIEISVDIVKPQIITEDVNDMGIKEVIGTGQSNFGGSPANRRHNIRNGASRIDGILIKPGEEFSLIGALGAVDADTGYLPELVIKDNKTIPEYGGGLCQIGTTIFRAAMASGLPITERRSHSYNVSYYLENGLPGTDATIYIPHPDVRFINDTGNYILIQSRIIGDNLYFDFWGTDDGRVAVRTTPQVWDWTSPPPTKYVESTDIPVGSKKCTEVSHKGVKASFDYIVTYPDGEEKKTNFYSHYKPWQAVCLVGVEQLSEETGNTASSTDEVIE